MTGLRMIALFVVWHAAANHNSEALIIAQSCYLSSQLQFAKHSFHLQTAGNQIQVDRKRYRTHSQNPFHYNAPFWYHFIDSNFHQLPMRTTVFNFGKRISFDPPFLYVKDADVMVMDQRSIVLYLNRKGWMT
jgi:hypothetical protein